MSKSGKSAYFRHVFANNFFWVLFFNTFSTDSKNQREIQRFLTPILNFLINFFNFDKFVKIVVPYCGFTTA
jgi:hypothetical protein